MKKVFLAVIAAIAVIACSSVLVGCNVTRTISTQQTAYQKGDTCISIVTKTTEVYDATKKVQLPL